MLSINDIMAAKARIRPYVHRTPLVESRTLNTLAGASLVFKCENFQKGGAFKARGAHNSVLSLSDEEAKKGVVAHSSGNHGAAVALAARERGIPAHIVVPENAVHAKVDNIMRFGASVVRCKPTMVAREATTAEIASETGAYFIHSYDDEHVIAGQGTCAQELLEDRPDLDVIVVPVGGGGLLAGTSVAAKNLKPKIIVVGAEPEMADDAVRSFREGRLVLQDNLKTIADGLRSSLSPLTFALIRKYTDEIVAVSESSISEAMQLIWSILKIVVEPSAAVALAAILSNTNHKQFAGKHIGIVLTGGNVDLQSIPWISS